MVFVTDSPYYHKSQTLIWLHACRSSQSTPPRFSSGETIFTVFGTQEPTKSSLPTCFLLSFLQLTLWYVSVTFKYFKLQQHLSFLELLVFMDDPEDHGSKCCLSFDASRLLPFQPHLTSAFGEVVPEPIDSASLCLSSPPLRSHH